MTTYGSDLVNQREPGHHIELTDGSTTVAVVLRNATGQPDPRLITRRPRQQGQYSPFTQNDWGGGRGVKDAQADRSRFADSKRAITRHPGTVMIGGQETYTSGVRKHEQNLPGSVTWQSLLTSNRYIAVQITASANGDRSAIYFWVRRRGTPTSTLTVELCSNSLDAPNTVLKTVTATTTNIDDTISVFYKFAFSSDYTVTAPTLYWLKIYTSTADSSANCWQVGTDAAGTINKTKNSSDNTSWSDTSYDLYYRLVDDNTNNGGIFFTYKRQLYFLTRPHGGGAPSLYINGDRGVATGTHSTTTLQDTTKTWTVNELAGATCLMITGKLSTRKHPYRVIASNTSDTLTFSTAFGEAPTTGEAYVVLGSNSWNAIASHGLTVVPTSVVSAGEICYFAQGDDVKMRRMREYVNNGAWTREFAEENNYATHLLVYKSATGGTLVGKANDYDNNGRPSFAQAPVEPWGRRLKFPFLINNCEATTGWTAGANAAVSVDNTDFVSGTKSIKLVVSSGPSNPVMYYATGGINLTGQTKIRFWIKSTAARAAGDVKIFLSASATAASTLGDLNVPALTANEWTQVTLAYTDTAANNVQSIGFRVTAATGTYYVDSIETVPYGAETQLGNVGEPITGLERYGDPETPWVFRTQSAGAIESGVFNPIPLREMSNAEHFNNGMGHTVHNVYLYFSFLHGIERYYRSNLDDVGPNREEGMPDTRQGYISSMAGYPGRFFYNIDTLDGYSCIMESTSGTDHHEVYRCDTSGKRIRSIHIQVVDGASADRLWFTEGEDIAWLPLPGNTLKEDTDASYTHTHEAMLRTGWIYGGERDAIKLFHSIKLFMENTTANRPIECDYKIDDSTAWIPLSTSFTTPDVQEVALSVSARRIKFRFRLQTNSSAHTPKMQEMIVSSTTRPETRYTYTMQARLDDMGVDMIGDLDTTKTASSVLTTLDGWMEAGTHLTMYSVFTPFNSKTVFLEPIPTQPVIWSGNDGVEKLSTTLILIEP